MQNDRRARARATPLTTPAQSVETMIPNHQPEQLVKSRQRVADHGEVFTPAWLVEDMLNLVKDESERIDSRFLEPACGSGNFLVPVLRRKLTTVQARYAKSSFDAAWFSAWTLISNQRGGAILDSRGGPRCESTRR